MTHSKMWNGIFFNSQVSHLISPNTACFTVTEDKAEGKETHKQTATEDVSSKGDVQKMFIQLQKTIFKIFKYKKNCVSLSNNFWAPENSIL